MKIQVDNITYKIEIHGNLPSKNPPILLLHGFTGNAKSWRSHARSYIDRGITTVAVDLLGHGETSAPRDQQQYAMGAAAENLVTLLKKLSVDTVHLVGYSMGGRLALYLAVHYPELIATLTLESASPGLEKAEERTKRKESDGALANWIDKNGVAAFVDRWEQVPLFASQKSLLAAARTALRNQRLQNSTHGLANSLRGMGTGMQPSLWSNLTTLDLPVHLIVGTLDAKFVHANRQMAELLPDVTLTEVEDAGHTVHLEKPSEFDDLVIDWLSRHNLKK